MLTTDIRLNLLHTGENEKKNHALGRVLLRTIKLVQPCPDIIIIYTCDRGNGPLEVTR